jgi:glycosyltransferase involved in cell wall biosynthesis
MRVAPVSVVIPTFDSGRWIAQAIDSALAQTVLPAQIIVVDDGSTDDTPLRLRPYARRVRVIRQVNQGVSAARNRGVAECTSDFIAFLDADDVWHPRKLEIQLKAFVAFPEIALLGTASINWPVQSWPQALSDVAAPDPLRITWADLAVKNRLVTSSVVVRANELRAAGAFDVALQGPEDRDLWLRIAESAGVAAVPWPLTGYRHVPGSVSQQPARCHAGMRRILRKLDEQGLWRGRWLLRRKAYGYMCHSCAYIYGAAGCYARSALNSLKSFAWYPLPFRRDETRSPYERPKRLVLTLLKLLHLGQVPTGPRSGREHPRGGIAAHQVSLEGRG